MAMEKLSTKKKNALLDYFLNPKEINLASKGALKEVRGISDKDIDIIQDRQTMFTAEKAARFSEKHNVGFISRDEMPQVLRDIYDPPIGFFARGDKSLLQRELTLGIVGSRKASFSGKQQARHFAGELGSVGFTIISGFAEGIDTQAHLGSIDTIGSSIAVLGSGINVCYPQGNRSLYKKMVTKGLVITECFIDAPPLAFHFPKRNRIISGLSQGILVIEAAQKSGALITAAHSLEQGKNVYAIPRDIQTKQSAGCNKLIKDGAKLVTEIRDILEDYAVIPKKATARPRLSIQDDDVPTSYESGLPEGISGKLMRLILEGYDTTDNLLLASDLEAKVFNSHLSMLELEDRISIEYGKIYVL